MAGEYKETVTQILKSKRRKMNPGNKARSKEYSSLRWLFPSSWEKKYKRYIQEMFLTPVKKEVSSTISERYQSWVEEAAVFDSASEIREDSYSDEIKEFINRLRGIATEELGMEADPDEGAPAWVELTAIAGGIYAFNLLQWEKITKTVLGVPFSSNERWWRSAREQWITENYNFLRRYSDDQITSINEIVSRGVRQGIRVEDIRKEIQKQLNTTRKKSELLARDQVGKLNGVLTKNRQAEAGATFYIWSTSKDERVRGRPGGRYPQAVPDHWKMEGMLCRWDDSSVYADPSVDIERDSKGNVTNINWKPRESDMPMVIPGEAIQCRCTAIAYWGNIISEVDEELEKEGAAT